MRATNNWLDPDMPKTGWVCTAIFDRKQELEQCQMCTEAMVRYAHVLEHKNYPEALEVGCICAGRMTEDIEGSKERETSFKRDARRRVREAKRLAKLEQKLAEAEQRRIELAELAERRRIAQAEEQRERERQWIESRPQRRADWLTQDWKPSANGNPTLYLGNKRRVTVFPRGHRWGWVISGVGESEFSTTSYDCLDDAAYAAFDYLWPEREMIDESNQSIDLDQALANRAAFEAWKGGV